jgi:large subunit ribosomal protein L22
MAEEKDTQRTKRKRRTSKPAARTKSAATKTAAGSTAKKAERTEAKPKTEAKAEATSQAKAKAEARPKAPAKPKAAPKKAPAKPKAEAKPKTKAQQKPKAEAKPKPAPKPKEEPQRPLVNARARYVRVAPRKARLIADQVRGMHIDDARTLLRFSSRGAARDIAKLIDSAAANAESNHDLVADELRIADIRVDEGPTLRRFRPRALGRATRINKRTSHIQVALTPEE